MVTPPLSLPQYPEALNISNGKLRIFSGSANPNLAQEISAYLGLQPGPIVRKRFSDSKIYVQ